jgi:hypothetical protein
VGSIPITRSSRGLAQVAQLVEHVLGKDEVTGSIPVLGSGSPRHQNKQRERRDLKAS